MTIAFGFIHSSKVGDLNALFFSSDSRITTNTGIFDDEDKIVGIGFDGGSAMVAKAGSKVVTDAFEETFRAMASSTKPTAQDTVPRCAERALNDVKVRLRNGVFGDPTQFWLNQESEFLIGYFFEGNPFIYSLSLFTTLSQKAKKPYLAIGSGSALANFMIASVDLTQMETNSAIELTTCIIEMCKLHDPACGGPCRAGFLTNYAPDNLPDILPSLWDEDLRRIGTDQAEIHRHIWRRFAENFKSPQGGQI